jgi:hypothetical protein
MTPVHPKDKELLLQRKVGKKRRKHDWSVFPSEERTENEALIQGRIEDFILKVAKLPIILIRYPDSLLRLAKHGGANLDLVHGFPDLGLYHVHAQIIRFIEIKTVRCIALDLGDLRQTQRNWWKKSGLRPQMSFGYTDTENAVMDFYQNPKVNEKMDPSEWVTNDWWKKEYERITHPHWTTGHGPMGATP